MTIEAANKPQPAADVPSDEVPSSVPTIPAPRPKNIGLAAVANARRLPRPVSLGIQLKREVEKRPVWRHKALGIILLDQLENVVVTGSKAEAELLDEIEALLNPKLDSSPSAMKDVKPKAQRKSVARPEVASPATSAAPAGDGPKPATKVKPAKTSKAQAKDTTPPVASAIPAVPAPPVKAPYVKSTRGTGKARTDRTKVKKTASAASTSTEPITPDEVIILKQVGEALASKLTETGSDKLPKAHARSARRLIARINDGNVNSGQLMSVFAESNRLVNYEATPVSEESSSAPRPKKYAPTGNPNEQAKHIDHRGVVQAKPKKAGK